jgi:DNA-binding MarR family transcriptional regulator
VVVFAGPVTLTALAEAEQVRLPTISRLARGLERAGLVARVPDPRDRRVQRLRATAKGRRCLAEGRARRVARLERGLQALGARDRAAIARAVPALERLVGI